MRKITIMLPVFAMVFAPGLAAAENDGHAYIGLALGGYNFDDDRGPNIDDPPIGSLGVGYQFNPNWAADLFIGTEIDSESDVSDINSVILLNGYRFLSKGKWRPYLSGGISGFSIDDPVQDSSEQVQLGFGVSGMLSDRAELRLGYQHFFAISDESHQDDAVTLTFNWHFSKPKAMAAAPTPEPESVPVEKEVVDTFELLVEFEFDKSDVKSVFEPQFREIGAVLTESPDISMTIEGHTDWIGTDDYNQSLSERRANAVKQKFVEEYGISANRIETIGYGEKRPVATNETSEGRQRNRRAISVILRPRIVKE